MAQYRIPYSEEYYGYIFFEADSLEEAQALIKRNDWFELEQNPGYYQKVRGGGYETLQETEIEELT